MQIRIGIRTGEVVDLADALGPVDMGDLAVRCEAASDPFETVALDLWESQEIHYVAWIEIDGQRKDEPFEYPGIPRWWEPGYEPPEGVFTGDDSAQENY